MKTNILVLVMVMLLIGIFYLAVENQELRDAQLSIHYTVDPAVIRILSQLSVKMKKEGAYNQQKPVNATDANPEESEIDRQLWAAEEVKIDQNKSGLKLLADIANLGGK